MTEIYVVGMFNEFGGTNSLDTLDKQKALDKCNRLEY